MPWGTAFPIQWSSVCALAKQMPQVAASISKACSVRGTESGGRAAVHTADRRRCADGRGGIRDARIMRYRDDNDFKQNEIICSRRPLTLTNQALRLRHALPTTGTRNFTSDERKTEIRCSTVSTSFCICPQPSL
ncbi:hypothetical protein CB1_000958008 [Camelus ferus]|nr:hypothetical protein CB1_000958008 [Camelus ferus]